MAGLNAVITGWGMYVPPTVRTNADLEKMVDTTDAKIIELSGIRERRIAGDDETTSTMGARAARRALDRAGLEARDVDAIICATMTPDHFTPSTACLIQADLGAMRAAVFDIGAACTGFVYGLAVARGLIMSGAAKTVLLVGAETMSRFIDWTDRATCILFGDGAGAAVIEASNAGVGIESTVLRGDGTKFELLWIPGGGAKYPRSLNGDKPDSYMKMPEGRKVFELAVKQMALAAEQAIAEAGLRLEDISLLVPHQANTRIIDAVAKRLRIDPAKAFVNIQKYGNTSAASIPIALCEAAEQGKMKRGDKILFVAFGAGMTWGASVMEWFGRVDAYRKQSLVGRIQRELEARLQEVVNR